MINNSVNKIKIISSKYNKNVVYNYIDFNRYCLLEKLKQGHKMQQRTGSQNAANLKDVIILQILQIM